MTRTPSTSTDEPIRTPTIDAAFSALSHPIRRHVLSMVDERNPRKVGEFVPMEQMGGDPELVRMALYHKHLPSLDEAGLVAWDPETETVTRGPHLDEVRPLIQLMHDHRDVFLDAAP